MTKLDSALALASRGFFVFPLLPGSKKPPKGMHFKDEATNVAEFLTWWDRTPDANVGIFTGKFGDGEALLVVDVDNKGDKRGDDAIFSLELAGHDFPPTAEARTASGGRHLFYRVAHPVRQSAGKLGAGLDIRSRGGYVVGAGSEVDGRPYTFANDLAIAPAPNWLIAACGKGPDRSDQPQPATAHRVDVSAARARVLHYLTNDAPTGSSGARNDTGYKVAARCKDLGVDQDACLELMGEHWKCEPALDDDELAHVVNSAYTYGALPVGAAAPEAVFDAVGTIMPKNLGVKPDSAQENGHPFERLNQEFAFVIAGGGSHILWETTDPKGRAKLEHLATAAFHAKFAAWEIQVGKKNAPVTEEWMRWKGRRGYDGIVFAPGRSVPSRFYNLWRGFAVEPAVGEHAAVNAWIGHLKDNVCKGDAGLARWLTGFFAHMVQRPSEKPLVALVFRGGKGVGKNALVSAVSNLLGRHALLTSNRRYLVGNFNGHLENLLMFTLDEAFWSGDKQAEGQLKDLITGNHHVIEHKGKEPYEVDNCTRVVVIGNEDWLVPASHDERRFAVFDVGEGRKQDRAFFQSMRAGMEGGGYGVLLRFLLDFDLSGLDYSGAPNTSGLMEQKHATLDAFPAWWLTCLHDGRLVGGDFEEAWPTEADCERFRSAFRRYAKDRNVRGWIPDDRSMGHQLGKFAPGLKRTRKARGYVYVVPVIDQARKEWDTYIGHPVGWE